MVYYLMRKDLPTDRMDTLMHLANVDHQYSDTTWLTENDSFED